MAEDIPNTPSMVQFLWEQVTSQKARIEKLEAIVKAQNELLEMVTEHIEEALRPENEVWEKLHRHLHPEEYRDDEGG